MTNQSRMIVRLLAITFAWYSLFPLVGFTQQFQVGTPFTGYSDSFYENFGVNFNFRLPGGGNGFGGGSRVVGLLPNGQFAPNISFTQGSAGGAIPPFGGFDPGSQGSFGFGVFGRGGGGYSLGMNFGKGSSRTMTSTAPSLIVQNGFGGSLFNGQTQPFVTGVFPVNGGGGTFITQPTNGVTLAQASGQLDLNNLGENVRSGSSDPEASYVVRSSTAETAVESVAEIKARKERERAATAAEIQKYLGLAAESVTAKEYGMARSNLNRVHNLMSDPAQKRDIKSQIESLRGREKANRK
ncbi:MAG: hypothetical protein ABL888_12570 [Pirellulaceae bacterium]